MWFAFLAALLNGAPGTAAASKAPRLLPGWLIAIVAAALVASCRAYRRGCLSAQLLGTQTHTVEFGLRLGLAVFGLILVEQLLRRAHPQARWGIKPLCVGLAGVFAFDLFLYAEAMLFGRLDPDIWVARGFANALVIPFVAIATARNTGWTIDMHVSRGVVFHSTALLVSGIFLLAIAGAGYFVRYFGGGWGRTLQIELLFGAMLFAILLASSGRFRSKLRVFVSKHFFSYRYDYRQEWLRFTRTLSAESSVPNVQEQCIKALANLVESPGGALWLKAENEGFRPASRWNMAAIDAVEPAQGSLARFLERTGWVINLREYASEPARYDGPGASPMARVGFCCVARRSARHRRRLGGIRAPDHAKSCDRRQLGSARPAQDREPAGGELSWPDPRDRSAARGTQVRRLQSDVRIRRA